MKTLLITLLTLMSVACASTTNITNNPVKMTDFVVGQPYELRKTVFVWRGRLMQRELLDSEGMLGSGTILIIRKVEVDRSVKMGAITNVYAEVSSGNFRGKIVDVTWISHILKSGYVKRNSATLKPA